MRGRACSSLAVLALALLVFAPSALAGEIAYCVTCKNPDQTYVCKVAGEGSWPKDAVKLYCSIRTAKEGKHASCSAQRDAGVCNGVEKVYSYDGPAIPPDIADDPRVKKLMGKMARNQAAFDKPKNEAPQTKSEAPQTMVELTGRAFSASRQTLRNARLALTGSSDKDQPAEPAGQPTVLKPSAAPMPPVTEPASAPTESRVERVKHAAQDAGAAVGNFARKSYRCVWSLFRNCSGEQDAQTTN